MFGCNPGGPNNSMMKLQLLEGFIHYPNDQLSSKHYSDKLAHIQVAINCPYSIAQLCTGEDTLAYISGQPSIDDVQSYNSLTTHIQRPRLANLFRF